MLKYASVLCLVFFAASCKKETITPTVPNPPVNPPPATEAVYTLLNNFGICNEIRVEGSYTVGEPLTINNRLVFKVNVSTPGTFLLAATSNNGYVFSASGSFTATGEQTVVAQGSGIPVAGAVNNLSIISQGVACGVSVTVIDPLQVTTFEDNDHMYFGNPGHAATHTDSINNYLMRKTYSALSYSRDRGIPNWVSWHLYAPDLGTVDRQDDFRPDNSLPAGWYQVTETSYSNSGFDRGHNTASGDRTSTTAANSSTFLMTNMIPQAPTNNQVVWARLEDSLRRLTALGYEVYIIMGNYGVGGSGNNGFATSIDGGRVTVPANIWKVAVILPNGNNDSSRVDLTTRIIAVDIPNTNAASSNWKNYRVSVNAIEAVTGYDLLTRIPEVLQADLEARVDNL
jgi:endonuclease G